MDWRKIVQHRKTGKRFINQALYIKSLKPSANKTIAIYQVPTKALVSGVRASILPSACNNSQRLGRRPTILAAF